VRNRRFFLSCDKRSRSNVNVGSLLFAFFIILIYFNSNLMIF
jgi:heme/copper-type cytochrome/quinol oxidase subunit 4